MTGHDADYPNIKVQPGSYFDAYARTQARTLALFRYMRASTLCGSVARSRTLANTLAHPKPLRARPTAPAALLLLLPRPPSAQPTWDTLPLQPDTPDCCAERCAAPPNIALHDAQAGARPG